MNVAVCQAETTFSDALAMMRALVRPLSVETVDAANAGGRVLAEPLLARLDAPRHDVAAMDGFAIREEALQQGQRTFRIAGRSYAGDRPLPLTEDDTAFRIMTGAILPRPTDRVIPYELVEEDDGQIRLRDDLPARSHVRLQGSDFRSGQVLLQRGTYLDPLRLLLVAASDQPSIAVHRRPRLGLIASGSELVAAGRASVDPVSIPDSLSDPLMLFALQWGCEPGRSQLVSDDQGLLRDTAASLAGQCDILVLVGGAGDGDRDYARAALRSLGLESIFVGVAIKPGKPVWFGRLASTLVLGLPGNPAAAIVAARLFLAPLLTALAGRRFDSALQWRDLRLSEASPPTGPRDTFLFAADEGGLARIIDPQSASAQSPLAAANLLVHLPADTNAHPSGAVVSVLGL